MHGAVIAREHRLAGLALLLALACGDGPSGPPGPGPDDGLRERFDLRALGEIPYPPGDPSSASRIALGKLLFFDPILGGEMDVACATCHHPDLAFADGRQFSVGAGGTGLGPGRVASASGITGLPIGLEPRNAQTILNAAFNADEAGSPSHLGFQFWDGRAIGLEEQARIPIMSRTEMAGDAYPPEAARDSVVARLRGIDEYVGLFRGAFPAEAELLSGADVISMDTYGRAVAAYERELVTRNSAFDRYARGDDGALTPQQKLGLELFFTKALCSSCHGGPMFSDFLFHVLGVPQEGDGKDMLPGDDTGREEHTLNSADRYAFRTPTLRNVELTAPYMHDGAFATL
ncbi:MAG: cytochrome-c peroxidase, partial [Candidatus Rokuibacteriota bacterium]